MVQGRIVGFILVLLMTALLFISPWLAKRKAPSIRKPAGLAAVEEAVGRATEMGRAIHYTPGTGSLTGVEASQIIASFAILGAVSRTAASMGAKMVCTIKSPELVPLAQEIIGGAYIQAGRGELYTPSTVRYLSSAQFAYAAGAAGIIEREQVAANFLIGSFTGESLMLAEVGAQGGAVQVAGCTDLAQIPFFVAACDYTLIGDEMYTAAALASDNRSQMWDIRGQDLVKTLLMGAVVVGVVLKAIGYLGFENLLKS